MGRGGRRRTQTHGVHMALAMGPRKKNVHDPGFAKKRDEAQVVEERSHRVGAAARKAGVGAVKAKNKRQAVFIFLDEPESSVSARLFSLLVVVAIIASSVSFVAETVPYVRLRPDLFALACAAPALTRLFAGGAVQERPQLQQPRGVRRGKKAVR